MSWEPGNNWKEHSTVVGPPVPPVPPAAPPPEAEPGDRIGLGMLVAIALLAAAAAALAAILLTRHHHSKNAAATTVILTTTAGTTTAAHAPSLKLPVPALVGQPGAPAIKGLQNEGFRVVTATVPSTEAKGTVVAQRPSSGTSVARGTTVRLNLSNGTTQAATTAPAATTPQTTSPAPSSASVPSLSGKLQPALQQLDTAGFVASIAYVPSTEPLGTVVAQSPQSGSTAPTRSQVTVNVSSGPNGNPSENVPNVVGQKLPQAVPALQHAGLRLIFLRRTVSDRSQAGVIVAQTPAAGSSAPKHAQVLVYMGAFRG